jgi:hypothetical protein
VIDFLHVIGGVYTESSHSSKHLSHANIHSDLKEKAAQVQLMGQIYQRANQVLVWLGATGTDQADPVAYPEHLTTNALDMAPVSVSDMKNDGNGMNEEQSIRFRVTLLALSIVMSQWFRRTWVVQELCWAKKVVFVVGNAQMSIQCLKKAFDIAKSTIATIGKYPEIRNTRWVIVTTILDEMGRVWAPQLQYGMFHRPIKILFELTDNSVSMFKN